MPVFVGWNATRSIVENDPESGSAKGDDDEDDEETVGREGVEA